jgi:cyclase
MLKKRIIPTLLMKNGSLVKGRRFDSWRKIGPVLPMIRVYENRQVDELILLDIAATPECRTPDFKTIESVASECFMPLTVGGGVRDLDVIRELLKIGADKVSIGTAFYESDIVDDAACKFGSQCITVAIDAGPAVVTHCGTQTIEGNPVDWARHAEAQGAGEILLTSVDRDGTMDGYDLDLIETVSRSVTIPVIASGGARDYEDFEAAFNIGAHAVAASALFQFSEKTPLGAKKYLSGKGIQVRL